MHHLRQFMIITLITLIGEALSFLIPLPVPAGIYGIIVLFALLVSGRLKVESVKDASAFLIEIMPVMFIPAAVGLMDSFSLLRGSLAAYVVILAVSTVSVMVVSGRVTQHVIRREREKEDRRHA
ncbi:MAG: CidA/LrgA family protein [Clostridia bacterium]|nr:CidA/LrgA family protein [Clostridia bacterium]